MSKAARMDKCGYQNGTMLPANNSRAAFSKRRKLRHNTQKQQNVVFHLMNLMGEDGI